jgi:hypothetical protein
MASRFRVQHPTLWRTFSPPPWNTLIVVFTKDVFNLFLMPVLIICTYYTPHNQLNSQQIRKNFYIFEVRRNLSLGIKEEGELDVLTPWYPTNTCITIDHSFLKWTSLKAYRLSELNFFLILKVANIRCFILIAGEIFHNIIRK